MTNTQSLMEAGRKIVIPERINQWDRFCQYLDTKKEGTKILNTIIVIMQFLQIKNNTYADIVEVIEQFNNSGREWEIIEDALAKFHPRGVEYVRYVNAGCINQKLQQNLAKFEIENQSFPSQIKKRM